nr:PREDICTED: uncharacterized protein LOC108953372 [Musa acuminata subsp. malaccensis]
MKLNICNMESQAVYKREKGFLFIVMVGGGQDVRRGEARRGEVYFLEQRQFSKPHQLHRPPRSPKTSCRTGSGEVGDDGRGEELLVSCNYGFAITMDGLCFTLDDQREDAEHALKLCLPSLVSL